MYYVECIKGFKSYNENSDKTEIILQGEVFKLVDEENNIFKGVKGGSRDHSKEIKFYEGELKEHFKLFIVSMRLD